MKKLRHIVIVLSFLSLTGCEEQKLSKVNATDLPRIYSWSFWGVHMDGPPFPNVHIVRTNRYSVSMVTGQEKSEELTILDLENILTTRGASCVGIWAKKDTAFVNVWNVIEVCARKKLNIYLTVNVVDAPDKKAHKPLNLKPSYQSKKQHLLYHSLQSVMCSTNLYIILCGKNSISIQGNKLASNELSDILFKHSTDFRTGKLKLVVLATEDCTYQEVVKVWGILYESNLSKASLLGVQREPDNINTNVTLRVIQSYW
jgi:hypothetical protein